MAKKTNARSAESGAFFDEDFRKETQALNKEKRVKKEIKRLREIFKNLQEDERAVCEGLIVQAARLRILLDDMWQDLKTNGDVEAFTQSENTPPYERLRPVAQNYNTRDKNYQTIIKQLVERLPETEKKANDACELIDFIRRKK